MSDDDLRRLADLVGIVPRYHDLSGIAHETSIETYRALLAAMSLSIENAGEHADRIVAERDARAFPKTIVVPCDEGVGLQAQRPIGAWSMVFEDGSSVDGQSDMHLDLLPVPMGYHRLHVGRDETLVISAPRHAPSVRDIAGRDRAWGVTGALYALRSKRNHGVGDFKDLGRVGETWADKEADFFGINPLHALGTATEIFSPYSPSHRGFLNTRHIALDEFADIVSATIDGDIDYAAANARSDDVLRKAFADFDGGTSLQQFCAEHGEALERFTIFEALSERFGPNPRAWPAAFQDVTNPAVKAFARENEEALHYHTFLQWVADRQLGDAAARLKSHGMAFGLYADLAVGVRRDGAEPWARPNIFARGATLGVPPDAFNPKGQEWGLAPIDPQGLADADFAPLIETLRATMRHAGMIRVDHAIGLMRCFWMPDDDLPGAYVRYPMDALLAILRLEATRNGCLVIAEDLGVVPDGLRDALAGSGLYGVSVMQFEREHDGGFRRPEHIGEHTLASFGTHDTPTFAGYWKGLDIDRRLDLGQYDDEDASNARDGRAWERRKCLELMAAHDVLPDGYDPAHPSTDTTPELGLSMHTLLARSHAALVAVQIDDALMSDRQPNFPGTTDEYPNWRVPLACDVEVLADAEGVRAVADIMTAARPRLNDDDERTEQ